MVCLSSIKKVSCSSVTDIRSKSLGIYFVFQGYSVDVSSEGKVIERVAKYHRAWNQQKEKSGLLQLLFLLFCKARFKSIMLLVYCCCLVVFFVLLFVLSLSRRTFKLEFKALIFFFSWSIESEKYF